MTFGRYFMLVHFTLTTLLTYSYQESIDCKTSRPMVHEGESAAITCTFLERRWDSPKNLTLTLKKDGSQSPPTTLSSCIWSNTSSRYGPQNPNGHVVTCPTTQDEFVMRILIPRAQKNESGNYLCNIQGGGKSENPCRLEVKNASIVTTCQSTSVQDGKNASLIYYFNKDILSTKPDITVIRDSVKYQNNNQPNNITFLDIWWRNGTLKSSGLHEDRYDFNLTGTTLVVYIQSALETDQGRYTCMVHGSEQLPASSCYLTLSEEKNNEVCSVQTDQCSDEQLESVCEALSVKTGENASVICYFSNGFLDIKPNITVFRDPVQLASKAQLTRDIVLDCRWIKDTLDCTSNPNIYHWNNTMLALQIQSASETDVGRYTCKVHSSKPVRETSCVFTVIKEEKNVQTDQCSGSTFIAVLVLGLLQVLLMILLVIVNWWKYNSLPKSCCRKNSKPNKHQQQPGERILMLPKANLPNDTAESGPCATTDTSQNQ